MNQDSPEMGALREALREAEDICRAIQHGEIDAFVVGRSDAEKRVLLMSGAYTRYRQIVEDMSQGAVTFAGSGEILFSNHSFAAMLEQQPIDILRTTLDSWVAQKDRPQIAALKAGKLGQRELSVELARRDGRTVPVRISQVSAGDDFVTALVTAHGGGEDAQSEAQAAMEAIQAGGVDAFVVDGRRIMMLEGATSLYRAMVERMHQGAVTVSTAGDIVYANERFVGAAGIPHGRLLGSQLVDLVAESSRPAFRSLFAKREGEAELRLRAANGHTLEVRASMTALDGHKLFVFTDITERKRHQAFDELTRKFLGMMAHEFRNILGPITNSVESLKRSPGLDADAQKSVAVIERQAARMLSLVEDLQRINPKD